MPDNQSFKFVNPITPKYREFFYSSIPVNWEDVVDGCILCLPCARDTFSPPDRATITIDGKVVAGA